MGDEKPKSIGEASIGSQGSGSSLGIPDALSFDRVISGGTCPVSHLVSGCYTARTLAATTHTVWRQFSVVEQESVMVLFPKFAQKVELCNHSS